MWTSLFFVVFFIFSQNAAPDPAAVPGAASEPGPTEVRPSSTLTRQTWWKADPFERTRYCNQLAEEVDAEKARAVIMAPLGSSAVERVREYLALRGATLPPPNGAFFEPKVKLSTTDTRRTRSAPPPPPVTDLLLGVPYSTQDDARNQLFADLAERGCLLRGLGRLKDLASPPVMFDAAFFEPTLIFREEITAALAEFGPLLVPAFLEESLKNPDREKQPDAYFRSRWARFVLQSTPSGNPRLNLQSATLDLQKKLMDMYASFQVAEAIGPILSFANHEDEELRAAAREAIVTYLSTGTTRAKMGTVKTAGGQETQAVLYISARSQAYHAVKQQLEDVTRGDYDRTTVGEELARQLFRQWDLARMKKHEVAFEQALQQAKSGDLDGAVDAYRQILAFAPQIPGKDRMAPAFLLKARQSLEDRDLAQALQYLRLCLLTREDPLVEADLYYLLGLKEEAAGDRPSALLMHRMALVRNPAHLHAAAAIRELDPMPRTPVGDDQRTGLLLAFLAALGLFVFLRWPTAKV